MLDLFIAICKSAVANRLTTRKFIQLRYFGTAFECKRLANVHEITCQKYGPYKDEDQPHWKVSIKFNEFHNSGGRVGIGSEPIHCEDEAKLYQAALIELCEIADKVFK